MKSELSDPPNEIIVTEEILFFFRFLRDYNEQKRLLYEAEDEQKR
jgi:hypothetical protein